MNRPMLTRDTLRGAKIGFAAHLKMQGGGGWMQTYADYPRLSVLQRGGTVTWSVDGKPVRDLDAALAVLNGEITLEEAMPQPEPIERPKKSLEAQIAEVEYELEQRKKVYARIGSSDPRKRSELELHMETMQAVRMTLLWLQANEATIKQRMSY